MNTKTTTRTALLLLAFLTATPGRASLEAHRSLASLIERGLEFSATFRSLFEAIEGNSAVGLRILPRFNDGTRIRAHSDLRIVFASRDDGTREPDPLSIHGDVLIPPDKGEIARIGLIAHELAHVLARVHPGSVPLDPEEDESNALSAERAVIAELEASAPMRGIRPIAVSRVLPPGRSRRPGENP